jgi:hypothetical protein
LVRNAERVRDQRRRIPNEQTFGGPVSFTVAVARVIVLGVLIATGAVIALLVTTKRPLTRERPRSSVALHPRETVGVGVAAETSDPRPRNHERDTCRARRYETTAARDTNQPPGQSVRVGTWTRRRSPNASVMFFRRCLVGAVAVILSTGCMSDARQHASASRSSDISASTAKRIAERLAVSDARGDPVLARPSDVRSMDFQDALTTIGSGADYSLGSSAPVWLVHVHANVAMRKQPPPRPPWAATTTTPQKASTSPPNYFVIVDAATGRVVVENY